MKRIIAIAISLLFCLHVIGQKIPFNNYTVKDGLPSNVVLDICQESKGYIWFATQGGVSRYDGYSFKNYTVTEGLCDNSIECIFEDSKGNLWFGSKSNGISQFDGYRFKNYNINNGLVSNTISDIFEDKEGNIWSLSNNGISIINKNVIQNYTSDNGLLDNNVLCYFIDSNNKIWLGTASGINIFQNGKMSSVDLPNRKKHIIRDISEDNSNKIWIATQEGVYRYEGNEFIKIETSASLNSNVPWSLFVNKDNTIWIGTQNDGINVIKNNVISKLNFPELRNTSVLNIYKDKYNRYWIRTYPEGIYLIENDKIYNYTIKNNLLDNYVRKIFEDDEGNLWFGTDGGGVSKYGKVIFELYDSDFKLTNTDIMAVFVGNDQKIYCGNYHGLSILHKNNFKNPFAGSNISLDKRPVYCITQDKNGDIWLGTQGGLIKYTNNILIPFSNPLFEAVYSKIEAVFDLEWDSKGRLWIAHINGLAVFDELSYVNFDVRNNLISNNVWSIAIDSLDNIWCCTTNGLSVYNGKAFINYTTDDGLPNNSCNDVTIDKKGNIWIATDGGLCKVISKNNKLEFINYTTKNGLASNSIFLVHADKENNIWAGHERGLNKINTSDNEILYYGATEGFTPLETYLGAIDEDEKGNLWFGTVEGLVKYNINNDIKRLTPPKVYITGVSLYNDTTNILNYAQGVDSISHLPQKLKLPYNKANLVFKYIGLHYSLTEKNQYQYKLESYDDDWSAITNEIATIPYQKIPKGNYTFKVRAANCDNVWKEIDNGFSFTVTPPVWQQPWFYALEIVIGLALIFTFIKLREKKLQQDKKVLAQKVAERTREIEKQKSHIEQQNKEITDSIHYAERIQSAVLPDQEIINKYLPDNFILFKPRDIVSGDFYWISGNEENSVIVAADCTGHGVPGAFMSMLGVSILNEIVHPSKKLVASKILNELRDNIIITLSQKGDIHEAKDGMDLALCIIDFKNKKLQFAGAYNPLYLIRDSEMIVYKGDKMPIGIHIGDKKYFTNHEIDIKKGDVMYMFSDGYVDQFGGGAEEKKFKSGPFKELLLQIYKKPMQEQRNILDQTIEEWKGDLSQLDDILVVGFKI